MRRAAMLTVDQVITASTKRAHVNGWVMSATDAALADGVDMTERFGDTLGLA